MFFCRIDGYWFAGMNSKERLKIVLSSEHISLDLFKSNSCMFKYH